MLKLDTLIRRVFQENQGLDAKALTDLLLKEAGEEWPPTRDQIAYQHVMNRFSRLLGRMPDASQSWLPGFEHISATYRDASLERIRARIAELERRIRSYAYPRRSDAKLKEDRAELREFKRLEKKTAIYFANQPDMTAEAAYSLYERDMQTDAAAQRRKAAKAARKAHWPST